MVNFITNTFMDSITGHGRHRHKFTILNQISGFIVLAFVPGFLILRILKIRQYRKFAHVQKLVQIIRGTFKEISNVNFTGMIDYKEVLESTASSDFRFI